ncbi:hypothetical protein E2C01_003613 [Portunus trituberculatus]|uniref:Uncharacterized protein n=1 Tax=Portunus trituberculatus TaxID=210409 RepID=A0A5B7CMV9_PORTR|nr:hypothetical protein [Portunus trituberculatus]
MGERRANRRGDSPGSRESVRSGGSSQGSDSLNSSKGFTGHSTLPSSSEGYVWGEVVVMLAKGIAKGIACYSVFLSVYDGYLEG